LRVTVTTSKLNATFQCGLQLQRIDTYLNRNKAEQITSGPLRGKYELTQTVDQKRGKPIVYKGQAVSETLYKPPLKALGVTLPKHLEPQKKALEGKDLSQDLKSLDKNKVSLSVVASLISDELDNMKMLTKKPTDKRPWSLGQTLERQKNKPLLRTKPSKRRPATREAVDPLENEDENPAEQKMPLSQYLEIPPVIKRASGAYRHREGAPTKRISLKCINAPGVEYKPDKYGTKHPHLVHFDKNKRKEQFFAFVSDVTHQDKLITVCCLQQDSLKARQCRCMCEDANGIVQRDKRLSKEHIIMEYNMTDSRFLMDQYRFRSVPMFLQYYNGRLVVATTTLNKGAGPTALKDFLAQLESSITDARSNRFLPDNFQFDPGCDNTLTMNFMDVKSKIHSDMEASHRAEYQKVQRAVAARNALVEV